MLIVFGIMIGVAVLSLLWGITARPPAARANLFAGLAVSVEEKPKGTLLSSLGQVVRRFAPKALTTGLEVRLAQAGHPRGLDVQRFLGIKVLCGAIFGIALGLAINPLLGLAAGIGMFFGPDYWLATQKEQRQLAMRDAAADTIDQLTITVEAGLGFDAAIYRVASSSEGPLAVELRHTVSDMRAGVPRDQALKTLAERTQIPEIKQLVTALVQAQKHGTPLAQTLRIQAAEHREKRTQRVEERAAKLSTKMIAPIILCFVPMFLVITVVPAIARLADTWSAHL
jgi:tight adherence protein C